MTPIARRFIPFALALLPALLLPSLCVMAAPAAPTEAADSELDAALAGILPEVGPEQRKLLARYAQGDFCYCGCPRTAASCLLRHGPCKHSARMLRFAAGVVAAKPNASVEEIQKFVSAYYSSFDRRTKIDLADWGPPLGEEKAPVTLVEYSDFTCPFCQGLRPTLEAFVAAHPGRVKLYFKPYPIESHPGALAAAVAGEWGRKQGVFWKLHDALFSSPAHDLETIAGEAEKLDLDSSDLREAITSRRDEARIRASQAEANLAGVHSTPTLFLNGRLIDLPERTQSWLDFTLEDEEEWMRNKGRWDRD